MYVFGCTLMSKPSVHCGGTELFDRKIILQSNKVVIYDRKNESNLRRK
jgi:hypothetical protein